MVPAGNNTPPNIIEFSNSCTGQGLGSLVSFTINKVVSGAVLEARITNTATGVTEWSDVFGANINARSYSIPDVGNNIPVLPNGDYQLLADNGEGTDTVDFTVNCAVLGSTCTIALVNVVGTAPTAAGGKGLVEYTLATVVGASNLVELTDANGGTYAYITFAAGAGTWQIPSVPPGTYNLVAYDDHTDSQTVNHPSYCEARATVVVPPYQGVVVPPVEPAPQWHPVGGVLPNQASLAVPVTPLVNQDGTPRVGLYVEVELKRLGAADKFATARRVIRTSADSIDVSQYLRGQLLALAGYPSYSGLFSDATAGFGFTYRYRAIDNNGMGQWIEPLGKHYGILAAMPPAAQNLLPYVVTKATPGTAATTGWPLAFASGAPAQVVGYPLEVALLLGARPAGTVLYLEAQYFDSLGNLLELRNVVVDDTRQPGYYRYCLPANPLPCAAYLELVVSDANRAFAGVCVGSSGTPGPGTGNPSTPGNGGRLIANGGFIKI